MLVEKYSLEKLSEWNDFVEKSKNGTFLFNRNFMDYHSDRFQDNSLMFYNESNKLIAILPANLNADALYSHQGLSYGGLICGFNIKISEVINCFESIKNYSLENSIKKLIYKRVPSIYHKYPADEDLYALFKNNAKLVRLDFGSVIQFKNKLNWSELRNRCLKKAIKENLTIKINHDLDDYFNLLSEVLIASHNVKPVHSLFELKLLFNRFPDNIKLVCSYKGNNLVSGIILFIEKNVLHAQYIANSNEGRSCGGLEIIIEHILTEFKEFKFLSFGISTEDNGNYLNEGLIQQKEGFGARGICNSFYELVF